MARVGQGVVERRLVALVLVAIVVGTAVSTRARAELPDHKPSPAESLSLAIGETLGHVGARAREVLELRTRATYQGAAIKVSCIDQKLRSIRELLAEAQSMQDRWSQAGSSVELRKRWLDRLPVLKIHATAVVDAARSCTDARLGTPHLTVEYTGPNPLPSWGEMERPPPVDRPPLASPY